ncbi:MAG: TolC family protein [Tenacibaculum sp.]
MKILISLLLTLLSVFSGISQKKWSLKECVDYALKNNLNIQQNQLNVQLVEKDIQIAKGNFLPNLSASSSGMFTSGLSPGGIGVLQNTQNFSSNFSLSSSIFVFNGFRNLNIYKQAKLGVESAKLDLEVVQNDISLQVVNTYLNVLFSKENLEVAKIQAEISKKQVDRAKVQFEAGAIPKGDLLNVQSTAANDIQAVVNQENSLSIALLQLAQLLQISTENFDVFKIDFDSPSASSSLNTSKEIYEKALVNRPEIERARLAIANSDFNVKISKSDYMPTFSINLGTETSYFNQFNNLLESNVYFFKQIFKDRIRYSASFSLNVPIFNRFQTKGRVAKSLIDKQVAEIAFENEKLKLQQTIEQAYLDAKAAVKTFEAAKTSLLAQKEAFKNAQVSYDYGAMTQFDFDQVRNRLVNAEGEMIRSKYDYIFKNKVLKFYFGEPIVD